MQISTIRDSGIKYYLFVLSYATYESIACNDTERILHSGT